MCPNAVEFDKPVDRAQQMRLGHVTFERELVEQSILLDFPIPHHRLPPSHRDLRKSADYTTILHVFQHNRPKAGLPPACLDICASDQDRDVSGGRGLSSNT